MQSIFFGMKLGSNGYMGNRMIEPESDENDGWSRGFWLTDREKIAKLYIKHMKILWIKGWMK